MPKDSAALGEMLVVDALNRMDGKLDKLDDRLDGVDKTLIEQKGILDEHVRRTDLLEQKLEADVRSVRDALPKDIEDQIRLQRNKFLINAAKVLGVVAGLGGGGLGLKELIGLISKLWGE